MKRFIINPFKMAEETKKQYLVKISEEVESGKFVNGILDKINKKEINK